MNSPDSEWLTVSEVAETLGTSTETVRRMIKAGKLPASRASTLPRAPWLINGPAWEQQKRADAERARVYAQMANDVVGHEFGSREAVMAALERLTETDRYPPAKALAAMLSWQFARQNTRTKQWLTVRETAAALNTSEEMVRRKIRAFELPASRLTDAERAPWMINAAALARRVEINAHKQRIQDSGTVVGGPREEFYENLEA